MSVAPVREPGPFASVEDGIEEIRRGRMVVVVDAADRENEGDLTIAAQFATPEAIAFMAKEGRGLICLCLTGERCDELDLRMMTEHNETQFGTAFTEAIDAAEGVTTGISAADRAHNVGRRPSTRGKTPAIGAQDRAACRPGHRGLGP